MADEVQTYTCVRCNEQHEDDEIEFTDEGPICFDCYDPDEDDDEDEDDLEIEEGEKDA